VDVLTLAWTIAIEALSWIELKRVSEDTALRRAARQLDVEDEAASREAGALVYGVMSRLNTLDRVVEDSLRPNNLGNLSLGVRSFLRIYTYIIHFGEGLAEAYALHDHAKEILGERALSAVDEAVELIPRQDMRFSGLDLEKRLAYTYSHPEWYVRYLLREFGENETIRMLEPVEVPVYIRVNTLRDVSQTVEGIRGKGFRLEKDPSINHVYRVEDPTGLTSLPGYRRGEFVIQDRASVLAGAVAAPASGELVLDVCAAPGIKTSHLAQLMGNRGRIISVDSSMRRLRSFEGIMERLGVEIAKPYLGDARTVGGLPPVEADLVLVDPPCTGSGNFFSEPSSRWRLSGRSIGRMADLQYRILCSAAHRVAVEGRLVYCTCSVTVDENEGVVRAFLDENPDFVAVEAAPRIGEPGLRGLNEAQRLYPHLHGCNGFFIAKMVRT
jgi:16S rRNA (cytosine967-C5)-methyltransferase